MSAIATQPANATPLSEHTIALLRDVPIFASLDEQALHGLDGAAERNLEPGDILLRQGELTKFYWVLLEGSLLISMTTPDSAETAMYTMPKGIGFGELPLLANIPSGVTYRASEPCQLLELDEDQFWRLMNGFPEVRKAILGNMAMRLSKMQATTFQQEKMASLGTLAAGLMHELNNPGSAAQRASSHLREKMQRMHRLTEGWAKRDLSTTQKECMFTLQDQALRSPKSLALSTLEQSDAEEHFAEWMEDNHVADAWRLAPTFVSIGLSPEQLDCARARFDDELLSDSLNWLEALVSSMQLVGTIEDSISRVTDLVRSVKSYAYEGRGEQNVDINASIHSTLVILGHKIREKQLTLKKDFGNALPTLHSACHGLNQIWTNLLDNAIDAAPQGGELGISTWAEPQPNGLPGHLCIMIRDNGPGIPAEIQSRIFDPFYTTKPVGVGTGLGLGIVYRIVEQYGGTVRFTSAPGDTEFVVRLPSARV